MIERKSFMRSLISLALFLVVSTQAYSGPQKRKVSDSEVKAVVQAVEDEIYDYGYENHFREMSENIASPAGAPQIRMRIYVDPEIDHADESGRVIYKLMPYGEVLREFIIRRNGLVVLSGDPQNGFPPTQESNTKTVYLDDDDVCRMKHAWVRSFFVVNDSPTAKIVQEAVKRQKLRTGFLDWEYRHASGRTK
jgi:hypothetical protein